jgi:ATP-dependent DNA helicase PIF1
MTVLGQGGTGKSVLINTFVRVMRTMFKNNNSVHVSAPTGSAAFNVGGETLHRIFRANCKKMEQELSHREKEELIFKLYNTIALFLDERSMIAKLLLGCAEKYSAQTAHGGGHVSEDWGSFQIIILFGDDYQLPPPFGAGAKNFFVKPKHTSP